MHKRIQRGHGYTYNHCSNCERVNETLLIGKAVFIRLAEISARLCASLFIRVDAVYRG